MPGLFFGRSAGRVRQTTAVIEFYHRLVSAYVELGWPVGLALTVGVPTLTFLFGVAVVLWLPADYFVRNGAPPSARHPVLRASGYILKNALGWFMIPLGIFMALPLVPGPGLVFILIGISLVDFPGKQRLEERLLAYPRVLHAVNRLRQRYGRLPMQVHPRGDAAQALDTRKRSDQ
jgi:hypothetical protein